MKKKKQKKKTPAKAYRVVGTIMVYNHETPGYWHERWTGNMIYVRGMERRFITVRWDDGTESENIPSPIIANPGDKITVTIRPA